MKKNALFNRSLFLFIVSLLFSAMLLSCQSRRKLITRLNADQRKLKRGQTVELSWQVDKAQRIQLVGIADSLPPKGTMTLTPDTTMRYHLVVERRRGDVKHRIITVKVSEPRITSFSVPEKVTDETPVILKWRVVAADRIYMPAVADSLPPYGSKTLKCDTTTTFTLIAANAHGYADTLSKTVEVKLKEHFDAPEAIYMGDVMVLDWAFKRIDSVYLQAGDTAAYLPAKHRIVLKPDKSMTVKLSGKRAWGDSLNVCRTVEVNKPFIDRFVVSRAVIKGYPAKISWAVRGKGQISIKGLKDSLPTTGSLEVFPTKTTDYTLELSLPNGEYFSNTQSVKVFNGREYVKSYKPLEQLAPAERIDFDIIEIDRSKYPEKVTMRVVAVDREGNFITHMAPPHVSERKSKRYFKSLQLVAAGRRKMVPFEVREVKDQVSRPYDITLVLDYSGSMAGSIDSLEKATKHFIDNKHPDDRINIVKFDHRMQDEIKGKKNAKEIIEYLTYKSTDFNELGGGTALYAAGDQGLKSLKDSPNNKVLLLFTDGRENASFGHRDSCAFDATSLAKHARQIGAKVFLVSYGIGTNQRLLCDLAMVTDGNYYNIIEANEIASVFGELPRVMRHYYEVTFVPPVQHIGTNEISMTFNNNDGNYYQDSILMQTSDNFILGETPQGKETYWNVPPSHFSGKKPVTTPQAIVQFDFDDSKLEEQYEKRLMLYVRYLEENQDAAIVVFGHTDSKGNDSYCLKLSERRAQSVKDFMIRKGVDDERIEMVGMGKKHPLWPEEEEAWQAHENRRIEIVLWQ